MPDNHPLFEPLAEIARHCWRGGIWKKTNKGPRHYKESLRESHLQGHLDGSGPAIGLAPIVPGTSETRIAVLDFDDHDKSMAWEEMCAAVEPVVVCLQTDGYQPFVFRSRGGHGVHVYLMFTEAASAAAVRLMLAACLRSCGLEPGTQGVAQKRVECYPKQNFVPADGCGSMFILPFAGQSEYCEVDYAGK